MTELYNWWLISVCLSQVTTRDQAIVKLNAEVDSLQQKHTSAVEEVSAIFITCILVHMFSLIAVR